MRKEYKVLIVDDSKSVLKALEDAFAASAFRISSTTNPLTAYEMIENEHFDIVVSDIMMPEMDGLTLLRKIKNFNGMIQVIMITGYITINNTLNAFRYGANDIFFKPFDDVGDIVRAAEAAAAKLDRINAILKRLTKEKRG
jgi:DNA-binding NtrC family response regulator